MTYEKGDEVAAFALEDDHLRVWRSTVLNEQELSADTQWIQTMHGESVVGRDGVSLDHPSLELQVVPIDKDLAREFAERGDTFTVVESTRDLDVSMEDRLRQTADFEIPSLDQDLERGDDDGWER